MVYYSIPPWENLGLFLQVLMLEVCVWGGGEEACWNKNKMHAAVLVQANQLTLGEGDLCLQGDMHC